MVLMGQSSNLPHHLLLNLRMALGLLDRSHSEMGANLLLTGNSYPTCKTRGQDVSMLSKGLK